MSAERFAMEWFRHPHLTRGIIHTIQGSFIIRRGMVLVPEEVGEYYGWQRVYTDGNTPTATKTPATESPAVQSPRFSR
jgi:hypothetical protein